VKSFEGVLKKALFVWVFAKHLYITQFKYKRETLAN